jgi:hypothetical protein
MNNQVKRHNSSIRSGNKQEKKIAEVLSTKTVEEKKYCQQKVKEKYDSQETIYFMSSKLKDQKQ